MKQRWRIACTVLLAGLVLFFAPPLPEPLLHPQEGRSQKLVDREGRLLREVLSPRAGLDRWVGLDQIDPGLKTAIILSEDQRFYWHPGLDPVAIARAAGANYRAGRALQGGSTITQQLVRNLRPFGPRTWSKKLSEAYYAVRLEARLSKAEVLECYLNRISFGNQCYGVEAASQLYFEKPARSLSPAQACFLAVIPRSPGTLDPYRDNQREEIIRLSHQLLDRMHQAGHLNEEQLAVAKSEPINLGPFTHRFEAPHFCDLVLDTQPTESVIRTSLDLELQHEVEGLLKSHLASLDDHNVTQGAVVVLEVESGELLAMVGSEDYFDFTKQGQYNAATARRQPGSTLKPFTYSLALEWGSSTATLLPDIDLYPDQQGESFIPKNYDSRFHGPVTLRTALACSYNVPAVRALESVGVERLLRRLRSLGLAGLDEDPEHYGLGLTLGDGGATLVELANAYRTLARGGLYSPWGWQLDVIGDSRTVLEPEVAFLITDVLADNQARVPAFGGDSALALPFPCAAKTGTSKGYRDNWTVGYTPQHVVAVWVGNFSGEPMVGVSGVTGAGPLFRDVMLLLGSGGTFEPPSNLERRSICPLSGQLPGEHCPHAMLEWFRPDTELEQCTVHRLIEGELYTVFDPLYWDWMVANDLPLPPPRQAMGSGIRLASPQEGTIFQLDPLLRPEYQRVLLKAVLPEGVQEVEWWVDNQLVARGNQPRAWWPMTRGYHQVRVVARGGGATVESQEVSFIVR